MIVVSIDCDETAWMLQWISSYTIGNSYFGSLSVCFHLGDHTRTLNFAS